MTKDEKKLIKKYLRNISLLLPIRDHKTRTFLRDFKSNVEDYAEHEQICSYEDLTKHFGRAREVVSEYLESFEGDELFKKLNIRKYVKILIAVIILAVISTSVFEMYMLYELRLEVSEHMIAYETIVIE